MTQPSSSPQTEEDRQLRRTLDLLVDLAESLASQTERLRQHAAATDGNATHEALVGSLSAEVERVRTRCDALARELAAVGGQPLRKPAPPIIQAPTSEPVRFATARPPDDAGAAETLALDLKLAGISAEEVLATLRETFGRDDAEQVVERVFRFRGARSPP